MNYLTFILLITSNLSCKGQYFNVITERLKLVSGHEKFATDTTGLHLFQPPKEVEEYCDLDTFGDKKYFHLADLNNDGFRDLIYSGWCNPYEETFIYLTKNGIPTLVFKSPGSLVQVNKANDQTILLIYKEPCCCDHDFDLTEVIILHNDFSVVSNQISFHYETKVSIGVIREIMIKGIIRTTPIINDLELEDECLNELRVGNHITTLSKMEPVFQIDKFGFWKLILFKVDETKSRIGWIRT